jgi:hypothetical protein
VNPGSFQAGLTGWSSLSWTPFHPSLWDIVIASTCFLPTWRMGTGKCRQNRHLSWQSLLSSLSHKVIPPSSIVTALLQVYIPLVSLFMCHAQHCKIQLPKIITFHFLCKLGDSHTYVSLAQTSFPPQTRIFNCTTIFIMAFQDYRTIVSGIHPMLRRLLKPGTSKWPLFLDIHYHQQASIYTGFFH